VAYTNHNGVELWYEVKGRGDPLVLIGGFALVHDQFAFCDEALQKKFRTVHWNYQGVGNSSWTQTSVPSVEQFADDLLAVLDAAGIQKTAIWGTSTGSVIGMRFAAKYPDRVSALVTYPWFRTDDTWRGIFDAAYMCAKHYGVEAMSRLFAGVVLPPDLLYSKEGIEYELWAKARYRENLNPATLRSVINAYKEVDLSGDIPRIKCPTLLLMGNESALNDDENMESASYDRLISNFQALLPTAEVATIKGAGSTYCMITKPAACVSAVTRFLATKTSASRKVTAPGRDSTGKRTKA
jgi:pimeloyl-ACP methyl ester carboxylesterase